MLANEVIADEGLEKRILPGQKTILYVGIKYDYGHSEWGLSYEHLNFYQTFKAMGYSVICFDYLRLCNLHGIEKMSQILKEAVYYYNPDMLFYFHFHDWIEHKIWEELLVKKVIWLADDQWRYEETKPIWSLFDLICTTCPKGAEKRGSKFKTHLTQWGYNHFLYRNLNMDKIYDISFVGGASHPGRVEFVQKLREAGIDIKTFGKGWPNSGRVSQADMIKVYNQSKIGLSLNGTSRGDTTQIKGRDFEIPGCGAMLLTEWSEEIDQYFDNNRDMITYKDANEAIEKIGKYLAEENNSLLRNMILHGHSRAINDHTYSKRLQEVIDVFQRME